MFWVDDGANVGATRRVARTGLTLWLAAMILPSATHADHRVRADSAPTGIEGIVQVQINECVENPPAGACDGLLSYAEFYLRFGDNDVYVTGGAFDAGIPRVVIAGEHSMAVVQDGTPQDRPVYSKRVTIEPGYNIFEGADSLVFEFDSGYFRYVLDDNVNNEVGGGVRTFQTKRVSGAFSGSVVGIEVGDRFMIGGPCVVKANEEAEFPLYLLDVDMGNEKVDTIPLLQEIFQSGSQIHVTAVSGVGGGALPTPRFRLNESEDEIIGSYGEGTANTGDAEGNPIKPAFLEAGLYELRVVWRMPRPVAGLPREEISEAVKVIYVKPPDAPVVVVLPSGAGAESERELSIETPLEIEPDLNRVAFLVERLAGSGGHEATHLSPEPVAADDWEIMKGLTSAAPITHPTGKIKDNQLVTARTNPVVTTYVASEFGGRERVTVYGVPANFPAVTTQTALKQALTAHANLVCQLGSVEIEVKVPDLELLPDATDPDDYVKVGGRCEHHGPSDLSSVPAECRTPDNNHWAAKDVVKKIQKTASRYDLLTVSTDPLKVNDISLPSGGRFDVNGNWKGSHGQHRIGRNVDIRGFHSVDHPDGVPWSGWDAWIFEKAVKANGGKIEIHGSGSNQHYHLNF